MTNTENTTQMESKNSVIVTDLKMIPKAIKSKQKLNKLKFIEIFDPTADIERTLDILGKLHSETTPGIRHIDDFSAVIDGYVIEAEQITEQNDIDEDGGEKVVVGVYDKLEDAVFSDFAHTVTPAIIKLVKAIIFENKKLKYKNKKISTKLEDMKFAAKYCAEMNKSKVENEKRFNKAFNNKTFENRTSGARKQMFESHIDKVFNQTNT